MSVQSEINSRTAKLQVILAEANNSIKARNGAEAADLNGIPAAIDAIPSDDPVLQVKTVYPTGEVISVTPDEGYDGLSAVNVAGDAYLVPENIAEGVTIYGVTGTHEDGETVEWHEYEIRPEDYDFVLTAPEGHGIRKITVLGDADLIPENIKSGVDIFGRVGTYAGYITVASEDELPTDAEDGTIAVVEG